MAMQWWTAVLSFGYLWDGEKERIEAECIEGFHWICYMKKCKSKGKMLRVDKAGWCGLGVLTWFLCILEWNIS